LLRPARLEVDAAASLLPVAKTRRFGAIAATANLSYAWSKHRWRDIPW